ncbi:hypothetical protein CEXT_459811 [Caerostris extrusa]|uniref:Uncharacterized protein n=1 Tax=Caerostris extrusa TaxID=172846 RepID=A0AAV4UDS2_CAEEX|nr:hypothetical protein CEXT_459811 [Caerostris extrusa]
MLSECYHKPYCESLEYAIMKSAQEKHSSPTIYTEKRKNTNVLCSRGAIPPPHPMCSFAWEDKKGCSFKKGGCKGGGGKEIIFHPQCVDREGKRICFPESSADVPPLLERNNGNSGNTLPGVTRKLTPPLVVRCPPIFGGEGH